MYISATRDRNSEMQRQMSVVDGRLLGFTDDSAAKPSQLRTRWIYTHESKLKYIENRMMVNYSVEEDDLNNALTHNKRNREDARLEF